MESGIQTKTPQALSLSEAIVLQQVHEDGEDDTRSLATALGMSREHTLNVIARLKRKGLVAIDGDYDGLWVHLTRKGRRLIHYLWPEARGILAV
jgi:DNA-binding MarR family transcriptional regulator